MPNGTEGHTPPFRSHRLFAWVYDATTRAAERALLGGIRRELLGGLSGSVLDVGAGTGQNFPYYKAAEEVVAVEPDPAMRRRAVRRSSSGRVPVRVLPAVAEALPFEDRTFDAVVFTLVLCTASDPLEALREARRVLVPGGRLVVLEHVLSTRPTWRILQRGLTPLWKTLAAGCHLDRPTMDLVGEAGFRPLSVRSEGGGLFPLIVAVCDAPS